LTLEIAEERRVARGERCWLRCSGGGGGSGGGGVVVVVVVVAIVWRRRRSNGVAAVLVCESRCWFDSGEERWEREAEGIDLYRLSLLRAGRHFP
jgi:MYXO-CTERM domain-containing protein